ncbi:LAETG motif-containing sortase-dependent surface protein [Streptomyces sp. NPDC052036]|uniref:LAETG motif-containing sortase-dependent surface protein n=1 Tax=unclassified Streptomyces TaxID=2593676 RepID=UPI003427BAA1
MSAARRSSSTARRTLLTATAAGTLLGALWFVPSANATPTAPDRHPALSPRASTDQDTAGNASADVATDTGFAQTASTATDETATGTQLADTGSVDTTPYVVGGALSLFLGAGFVTYSVRRERMEAW